MKTIKFTLIFLAICTPLLAAPRFASETKTDSTSIPGMTIASDYLEGSNSAGKGYAVIVFNYKKIAPPDSKYAPPTRHDVRMTLRYDGSTQHRHRNSAAPYKVGNNKYIYITDPGEWSHAITAERFYKNGIYVKYQFSRDELPEVANIDAAVDQLLASFEKAGARQQFPAKTTHPSPP